MNRRSIVLALAALAAACGPGAARAQSPPPQLERYLRTMGLGPQELAAVSDGRAVAKRLTTANEREAAVLGVVRVRASRQAALAYVGDPARFLAGRRFHTFSSPPSAADVRAAVLDASEYGDLRDCRPGSCDFKLPAAAMKSFAEGIDWSAPDARTRADAELRAGLVRLAADYAARGNRATVAYDDAGGVRSADVFNELAAQGSELYDYAPELERYLKTFPSGRPEGARDILYWAEDRIPRLRPTLTVNHLVLYTPSGPGAGAAVVAQKQIYASHYLEGAFELLGIVDAAGPAGQEGVFLVTVRRFRFDRLPVGAANIRGRVRAQLVEATQSSLEEHRARIEAAGGR